MATSRPRADVARLQEGIEQRAQILDLAHDTILVHDLDNRLTFWNVSAEQMYGWSREEALGRVAYELLQTEFPVSLDEVRQALDATGRWEGELIHTRRDGTQVVVASRWALQRNSSGEPVAVLEINRDITDRKRADEERRYILSSAGCMLWYADVEDSGGEQFTWNIRLPDPEAAQRFLPVLLEEGRNYIDSFFLARPPEDQIACDRLAGESIRAGRGYQQEFRFHSLDGSIRWVHEDVRIETVVEGKRWRAVGVCTDITGRKAQDAQIQALNERLQRSMRETHHRVKNNLQVISALTEIVVESGVQSVPISALQRVSRHVRSLAGIHDLLAEQVNESGDAAQVSAADVLEKLLPAVQHLLDGRALEWNVDDARLPARLATALAVLVNELVWNAAKHGRSWIALSLEVVEGTACLVVRDDGPGFPAGFDPLRDAHTGLELVESVGRWDLQGEIRYDNRPEGGARVTVTFPLAAAEAALD